MWKHTVEEAPNALAELIDWQQILVRIKKDKDDYYIQCIEQGSKSIIQDRSI